MKAKSTYEQNNLTSWTRVELLLALYDRTILELQRMQEAIVNGRQEDIQQHRVKAHKLVVELVAGVDPDQGEIAVNTHRLYTYVNMRITEGEADGLRSAIRVMESLREGYREIRADAIELESTGAIPSPNMRAAVERMA